MALSRKVKVAIASSVVAAALVGTVAHIKTKNHFKPNIWNYQAYMSKESIEGFSKNFSYKEFGDVSEFSKAIEDKRAIAGVGSDFQIAWMAQKELIRKVDFARLFKSNKALSEQFAVDPDKKPEENLAKRRAAIASILRPETLAHLDNYNAFMYKMGSKQKGIIDVDGDGLQDQLWEFVVPYFIQDKVVAYTTGDYDNNGTQTPLRQAITTWDDAKKQDIRENGIKFPKQDLVSIAKTLRENGYKYFEWTEAMRDNLLAGSELVNDPELKNNGYTGVVDSQNYIKQIDKYVELVKEATGHELSNTEINSIKSSGLELLTALIDPNVKTEVGFIYNGDALDALNGSDNFSSLEDGTTLRVIRPKNNLTLLDGWIITKDVDDNLVNQFIDDLYENLVKGEDYSVDELVSESLQKVNYNFVKEDDKFVEKKGRGFKLDFSALPNLNNFDAVNYTPAFKSTYEYFEKFYFNDAIKEVKKSEDDEEAESVLVDANDEIISALPSYQNIKVETSEGSTMLAKNIYKSQPKKQTINGLEVKEDTPEQEQYEVVYKFIVPVGESLNSEIKTEYNSKTKS
ncbi:hypothetical protein [Mycoplasma procyoni]|uniref:hypothetical protein n=1 Tax=Mycoplasma procyoni TaxID=568784 RepID=UPI00197C44BE|nr:hypothetical protein [Mycoplasma procyoni]MBN3534727.1 hypothetical protein [Mycoplasma procyoni]